MAVTWKKPGTPGIWNVGANWSSGSVPGTNDDVSIPGGNSSYTVTINTAAVAKSVTVSGQNGSHPSTITVTSGSSLTTSGSITLNSNAFLDGAGTITADGGITGSGTLQAGTSSSGGTLDVFGTIQSGIGLAIGSAAASTLKIEGTATASSAISINNSNQTLEIGSSGALTITPSESITRGTIKLDGGSLKISSSSGLILGSGSLTGYGTVTGTVNGQSGGAGTITAVGGTLEFKSAVDGSFSTPVNFTIDAGATLKFDAAVGNGSSFFNPTINFSSSSGVLDLSSITGETSAFHGTVSGFESGDQIKFSDSGSGKLTYTTSYSGSSHITTVTVKDGSSTVGTVALSGDYRNAHFGVSESGNVDTLTTDAACLMAGTMILTPNGEVAVETLKRGDAVLSSDSEIKLVSWIGVQTISTRFADKMRVWPIRIKAGALGESMPARDLLLSPDHAVLVDGVLIQAGALVNGMSIVRETEVPEVFTYYHVEVDDHSLILADNTPAETFVDNVDRLNFDNWAEHEALYPGGKPIAELPHARAKSHRQVPVSIREMLSARARQVAIADDSAAA